MEWNVSTMELRQANPACMMNSLPALVFKAEELAKATRSGKNPCGRPGLLAD